MNVDIKCVCGEHDRDTVVLKDRLSFSEALIVRQALRLLYVEEPNPTSAQILATLSEVYLTVAIASWTLQSRDDKGKVTPIPVSNEAVGTYLIPDLEAVTSITDACDELYTQAVVLPLFQTASTSSPDTPTTDSTSPPTPSSTDRPKRSKRSSITTFPTAATETTSSSLDGGSSLSPSSESAA